MDSAERTASRNCSVSRPRSSREARIASRRFPSSRSCDKRSRMLVITTSSRLAVASLRYLATKGTVAPPSSRPTVACTCPWVNLSSRAIWGIATSTMVTHSIEPA